MNESNAINTSALFTNVSGRVTCSYSFLFNLPYISYRIDNITIEDIEQDVLSVFKTITSMIETDSNVSRLPRECFIDNLKETERILDEIVGVHIVTLYDEEYKFDIVPSKIIFNRFYKTEIIFDVNVYSTNEGLQQGEVWLTITDDTIDFNGKYEVTDLLREWTGID